jgi:hypothetical protein
MPPITGTLHAKIPYSAESVATVGVNLCTTRASYHAAEADSPVRTQAAGPETARTEVSFLGVERSKAAPTAEVI